MPLRPCSSRRSRQRDGAVVLAKVDVDANPGLSATYRVQGIPAVKAFRDGRVVAEFVGARSPGGGRRRSSTSCSRRHASSAALEELRASGELPDVARRARGGGHRARARPHPRGDPRGAARAARAAARARGRDLPRSRPGRPARRSRTAAGSRQLSTDAATRGSRVRPAWRSPSRYARCAAMPVLPPRALVARPADLGARRLDLRALLPLVVARHRHDVGVRADGCLPHAVVRRAAQPRPNGTGRCVASRAS